MANISFEKFANLKKDPFIRSTIFSTKTDELKSFNFDVLYNQDDIDRSLYSLIIDECRQNIWFFFREIARVPSIYHNDGKQFELTTASYAIISAYENNGDFVISSIYPGNQIRETLILLSLYEYICGNRCSISKSINIFNTNKRRAEIIRNEICQYAQLLTKALPIFLTFDRSCINIVNSLDDSINSAKMTANSEIIINDHMEHVLSQNLFVFDYTSMEQNEQFNILECMYKYWHRLHTYRPADHGRLIIEADGRNLKFGTPVTSFLQYMITVLDITDICDSPSEYNDMMIKAATSGDLIHIKESIYKTDCSYKYHISKEFIESL